MMLDDKNTSFSWGMVDGFKSEFVFFPDFSCKDTDFTHKNGETCQPKGMATCLNHQEVGCLTSGFGYGDHTFQLDAKRR